MRAFFIDPSIPCCSAQGDGEQAGVFIERAGEAAEVMRGQWQFFTVLVGVVGFAAYNLVRTFVGDS